MARSKTPETALGRQLRTFAAAYAATGQRDRAEGLLQAADTVDRELAGVPINGVDDPLVAVLRIALEALTRATDRLTEAAADLASAAAVAGDTRPAHRPPRTPATADAFRGGHVPVEQLNGASARPRRATHSTSATEHRPVTGETGERRVLTAIAHHRDGVTRPQLTVLTGYKRSSRDTYVQRVRARGLVDLRGERLVATAKGIAELGPDFRPLPPSGLELRAHWLTHLPEGERRVLAFLLEAGRAVSRDEVSAATDYRRSSRDSYIQRLAARELVVTVASGQIAAAPLLMEARS
jgi:hypothetical protein